MNLCWEPKDREIVDAQMNKLTTEKLFEINDRIKQKDDYWN